MSTLESTVPTLPGGIPAYGNIDLTSFPVKLVNAGPTPLKWSYNNQTYLIPNDNAPHMVPYMVMVRYMGDPRSVDIGTRPNQQHRLMEYRRLRKFYGVNEHDNLWHTATGPCGCTKDDGGDFSQCTGHLPNVKAYSFDDQQIITVLDDPEGKTVNPSTPGTVAESDMLREMVLQQSAQLQAMSAQLQALEAQNAAMTSGDPIDLGAQGTTEKQLGPEAAPTPAPKAKGPRGARDGSPTVTQDQD